MRLAHLRWVLAAGLALQGAPLLAHAQDVAASAPFDLSVTVYRDPYRFEGAMELDYLQGFALITESRHVTLQPGDNTLRFEGVADGIEPSTAIVTGLPSGVLEKNRDAMLLSPSTLVASAGATQGRVWLTRTDAATGRTTRTAATVRSAAGNGVIFESEAGVEALRCSGEAESFAFESAATGLAAKPTLSVRTRVTQPVDAVIQLSYLSTGFDWSADYVADRSSTKKAIDLGAWITLANGNSVSFPNARVQVVAGRVNHQTEEIEPIDFGGPILAYCWPQGRTTDFIGLTAQDYTNFAPGLSYSSEERDVIVVTAMKREETVEDVAVAVTAIQEDLGDLKLYRVPDRTTLLSHQSKQVRMFDRKDVPVTRIYQAEFMTDRNFDYEPMTVILRTRNDKKNNLGLPLPSGGVRLFETVRQSQVSQRLLAGETTLRDIAVNEETEFEFVGGADVLIRQIHESAEVARGLPRLAPIRGLNMRGRTFNSVSRIEISNARNHPVDVEIQVETPDGFDLVRASHKVQRKNGRTLFKVTVPANGSVAIRYQTSPQ